MIKYEKRLMIALCILFCSNILWAQEINAPSRKKQDDGKIHWYALELKADTNYWQDMNTAQLIIECTKGMTTEDKVFKHFIQKNNLHESRISAYPEIQNYFIFDVSPSGKEHILQIIQEAQKISCILYAEPVPFVHMQVCNPNDVLYPTQWGPHAIRADSVWCKYKGAGKSFVAVLDNAVDWNHEDLKNTVAYGYDFANKDNDPTPDNSADEHGTHVTGVISAKIGNTKGIAGISNDTVYFAKISDGTALQYAAILDALNYISTDNRIRVINMSFGSSSITASEQSGVNVNWSKGKVLVASAGNNASSNSFYPASYGNVVSVSAIGKSNSSLLSLASYSNYGSTIDITAPGGEANTNYPIVSTLPGNTYGGVNWVGTSMSAPHVAAVAGLIFDANPLLTNVQARSILESQTIDMGTSGWDQLYGNGLVCASCAFREACNQLAFSIGVSGPIQLCPGKTITISAPKGVAEFSWYQDGILVPNANAYYLTVNQVGVYTASISAASGICKANSKNAITIINPIDPVADFTFSASNKTITFVNKSTSAISYLWDFGDGTTDPQKNPTYTYSADGTYLVTLTAMNLCGTAKTVSYTVHVSTSGISEYAKANSLQVYPDPAGQYIHVLWAEKSQKNTTFLITDMQGRLMKSETPFSMENESENIDISAFMNGVYFIHILSPDKSVFAKFVVQK